MTKPKVIHISPSPNNATRNYKLIKSLLDKLTTDGHLQGTLEFVCPDVLDLRIENKRLSDSLEATVKALTKVADYDGYYEAKTHKMIELIALARETLELVRGVTYDDANAIQR